MGKLKMNGINERIWARAIEDMEEDHSEAERKSGRVGGDQAWEEFLSIRDIEGLKVL